MQSSIASALLAPFFLCSAALSPASDASAASAGDPTRFVSRDAVAYVQATSIDAVESSLRAIVGAIDADAAAEIDVRAMLLESLGDGVKPELIDGTRPLAIAIAISPTTMQPVVTVIVPTKSRDELVRQLGALPQAPLVESDGDYVAWHSAKPAGPVLASEANPFAQGLPQGVVAARVDLAKLIEIYRPMIDMGLDQAEEMLPMMVQSVPQSGMDLELLFELYLDGARSLIDSAERLELAFGVQGSRAELSQSLTVKKDSDMDGWGSPEATGIEKAAYLIEPQASFAVLLGMEPVRLLERCKPLLDLMSDVYPEPMGAAMEAQMKHIDAMAKLMGKTHAMSGDLAQGGMRFSYYIAAPDPAALMAEYVRMMTMPEMRDSGLEIEGPTQVEIAGVQAQRYRMKMSDEWVATFSGVGAEGPQAEAAQRLIRELYGEEGMRVTLAAKNGFVAMVLGGDDAYASAAIARLSSGATPAPTWLGGSLAMLSGQNPCIAARVDLGPIVAAVESMTAAMEDASKSASARAIPSFPIDFRAGIGGRTWSGAWSCDVVELGRFAKVVKTQQEAQTDRVRAQVGVRLLHEVVANYQIVNGGELPKSLEVLTVPDASGASFLEKLAPDPWGNPYVLTVDGSTFRILSYGSDGKPGGEGDAADIDSTTTSLSDEK